MMPKSIETLEARQLFAAVAGTVNAAKSYQTIDALGAATIAWESEPVDSDPTIYNQLVNDLGASGLRGAAWPNFEIGNDNNDPNVFDWSKFDSKQLGHVLQFDQRFQERGEKTGFILSVWTPPSWMKTNRSAYGGGTLRPDMRAEFAEYLAAVVIASKRDFGVDIGAISIQNEQFFPEQYESAIYDAQTMRDTLVAIQKKFAYEHLTTKIIVNEDLALGNGGRWQWYTQAVLDDDEIDRSKVIFGSHYPDPSAMPLQAQQLAGTGVPLWYTEVSGKGGDWLGGLHTDEDLSDIFTQGQASAYYYWTYNNTTTSAPADQKTSLMANGVPNGKYYALKHFYKYVRPGMKRIDTTIGSPSTNRLSAFRDTNTGATTVVLINDSATANTYTLSLNGLGATAPAFRGFQSTDNAYWQSLGTFNGSGGSLAITIPAQGIVTLYNGVDPTPITGVGNIITPVDHVTDSDLNSPLREAALQGDIATVNSLLTAGANPNDADPATGWTALDAAVSCLFPNAEAVVQALIAAGANVNSKDIDGFTPLHVAAMNQFLEFDVDQATKGNIVRDLRHAGADANARDNLGRTPLMWAALTTSITDINMYNASVPAALVNNGADRTIKDNAGRTAYDYATLEYKSNFLPILTGSGLDTVGSVLRYGAYSRDRNSVSLVLTQNVTPTLDLSDIHVINRVTNAVVTVSSFTKLFSNGLTIDRANFASRLPDGHYRLTIPAGAFSDSAGVPSSLITVDFDVLSGDANGDGIVSFGDLAILAQNYGQAGRMFSQGDFNGDGKVDFSDLVILGQQYGKSLPAVLVTDDIAQRRAAKHHLT